MNKLKQKEQIDKLSKQISELTSQITTLQLKASILKAEKERAEAELGRSIVVTDHAVVRYFERVRKYELDRIKETILTEEIEEQINTLGDGVYSNDGFKIVVRNNAVVSVVTEEK